MGDTNPGQYLERIQRSKAAAEERRRLERKDKPLPSLPVKPRNHPRVGDVKNTRKARTFNASERSKNKKIEEWI